MSKKIMAILCALTLITSALGLAVFAKPGTLKPSDDKRVLKPGCVDEMTAQRTKPEEDKDKALTTNAEMRSDYATAFGRAAVTNITALPWTMDGGTSFWGKTPTSFYRYWGAHKDAGDSGLMYKVRPGTWVSVPVSIHNGILGLEESALKLNEKFWFDCSADGQSGWQKIEEVAGRENTSENTLRTSGANAAVFYMTVKVPDGMNFLRFHFPPAEDLAKITYGTDWIDNGAMAIGYAKASSTEITSYTGEGSGDPAVDYYEDPEITAKPRPANDNSCGYKNRVISLERGRVTVRSENGAAVTLQNVVDGLVLTQCTVEFYKGEQKITDMTAKVENGIVMKAISEVNDKEFASYTMWIYNYTAPTVKEGEAKKTLKPGVIDTLAKNADGNVISDYATIVGYFNDGQSISGNKGLGWPFDNSNYTDSNVQWGQAHQAFYTRFLPNGASVSDEAEDTALEYRVVAGSYVAIPVRTHNNLYNQASIADKSLLAPVVTISKDGTKWDTPDEEDFNTFYTSDMNSRLDYYVYHIPEGYNFLRAGYSRETADAIINAIGQDWVYNGAYTFGMAKASWTPITGPTGEASGDPVVGWYDDSTLTSKDVLKVNLQADGKALVRKVGDEKVTLKNVLDNLGVTLGEVKFFDADDEEITDLNTEIADGQVIRGLSKGHLLNADGTVFAEYTIEVNAIAEIKAPEITSKDDSVVIDSEKKTITATFFFDEPMSYKDLVDALEVEYGEIAFASASGAVFTDLEKEIDGSISLKLVAKDCPGVPDGTVTAEYKIVADKQIKEVKFESKDESKVRIDADEKMITVIKGMTIKEFVANLDLEYAELEFYGVTPEDFGDPELITDENTVILPGMSLILLTDSIGIPYEFAVVDSFGDESNPGSSDDEPIPETGSAFPLAALAVMGAAALAATVTVRRRSR